ncbi:MAG: hypothetical protein HQL34_10940 [Alphaproteobacteria bacterium]|nr:hypothetical protein [Alphaproteobacteria bacterium]
MADDALTAHLIVMLFYFRIYATQAFIGALLGATECAVCRAIRRIEPVAAAAFALRRERALPAAELETILLDCTEQPIERPKYRQRRHCHRNSTRNPELDALSLEPEGGM